MLTRTEPLQQSAESAAGSTTYNVKTGDSLSVIAKRNNVSVEQLKQTNNLTTDMIRVGQVLRLPIVQTSPVLTSTDKLSSYTVAASLSLIAKKNNVIVEKLKQANNLTTDNIRVGQILNIPVAQSSPIQTSTDTSSTNTVAVGDSLSAIAKRFNVTIDTIKQMNHLTTDVVKVGQTLKIPLSSSQTTGTETKDMGKQIQSQLQELGYLVAQASTNTGNTAIADSIKEFQKDYGLSVTGVADAATQNEIYHAILKKTLVQDTLKYQGVPYLWGGATTKGFDCSGFVYYMFHSHGINQTRSTSANLFKMGKPINKEALQPGDLVFFAVNTSGVISYVGFYMGNTTLFLQQIRKV
jgi:peptidoglycan DL-endopeptidase LytF